MPLIPKEQNSHVYLNIPKNSISTEFDSGKKWNGCRVEVFEAWSDSAKTY